jgi:exopolysaccharide production protein ExoQ
LLRARNPDSTQVTQKLKEPEMGATTSPASPKSNNLLIPALACLYATVFSHLLALQCSNGDWNHPDMACVAAERLDNRLFWPVLSLFAFASVIRHRANFRTPVHIVCLFAYVGFAGLSVLWAFAPSTSFVRYLQQVMIISCIVLPAITADKKADLLHTLFSIFAFATMLNLTFIFIMPPMQVETATPGYAGYFGGKNYMGQLEALAFLLTLNELFYSGRRRIIAIVIATTAVVLLFLSNSRTALALALIAPFLAAFTLILRKTIRISPAMVPVAIFLVFWILCSFTSFSVYRLSYMMNGEPTFTGRSHIWRFANYEIDQRPVIGWGYQSFWLVGPTGPANEAQGWVKAMPHAHNGYLDTMLELGYVGFFFFLAFVLTTLHYCGRVLDLYPARGWSILGLAYFVMINNFLESTWMRGAEFLWVAFLFLAAEIARCQRASQSQQSLRPVSPERALRPGVPSGRQAAAMP